MFIQSNRFSSSVSKRTSFQKGNKKISKTKAHYQLKPSLIYYMDSLKIYVWVTKI
ncbi:hypothetical protein Hanom_Chr16g01420151 [Helianthus anomalus]